MALVLCWLGAPKRAATAGGAPSLLDAASAALRTSALITTEVIRQLVTALHAVFLATAQYGDMEGGGGGYMLGHAALHMRQCNAAVTDDGVSDLL